jgi:integrase/recombinase XerC
MTIEEAIQQFLRDLGIGQAQRTVRTYTTALNHFRAFLSEVGLEPSTSPADDLTPDHALDWVRWLDTEQPDLARVTLSTYVTALLRFYSHLAMEGLISLSAEEHEQLRHRLHAIRGRAPRQQLPKVPPEEIVARIMAAARSAPHDTADRPQYLRYLRNIAIAETLRATGMRVAELVSLRRRDLIPQEHTAIVTGKGDKQRVVYFDETSWRALQTYLTARQDGAHGQALGRLPILARHDRGAGSRVLPISTNTVRQVLNDLIARAGVAEYGVTPHSFRHYFATKVLEATGDLGATQDLLGHASPSTTRIYAKLSSEALRRAHEKAFGKP